MAQTQAEIKRRYFDKKLATAFTVTCACGCGKSMKGLDRYGRPKKYLNGHNGRKYMDPNQRSRAWNHAHRRERYEYRRVYHRERRVKLIVMFGGKCLDCGVAYDGANACIFHFHHRDPKTKLFAVGNMVTTKSWASLVVEAQKCDLICANCHEKRHSTPY